MPPNNRHGNSMKRALRPGRNLNANHITAPCRTLVNRFAELRVQQSQRAIDLGMVADEDCDITGSETEVGPWIQEQLLAAPSSQQRRPGRRSKVHIAQRAARRL